MKKYLISLLCAVLVFSMTVPAFAAGNNHTSGSSDDSSSLGLGDLGDALSELFSNLSSSIPEVLNSVEEAIPELVSGIRDAIDEGSEGAKDVIDSITDQIGTITESGEDTIFGEDAADDGSETDAKEALQGLLDQLAGTIGSTAADENVTDSAADEIPAAEEDVLSNPGTTPGGWTVNKQYTEQLTEEEKEIFQKAETTLAGGEYIPVAVIAEQVVAGTNYAYLCLGAPDDDDQTASWYIVALYQDLQGNVSTLSIKDIELDNIEIISNIYNPAFVGAWTAKESEDDAGSVLPAEAEAAFEAALNGYTGVGYTPIALLGTQLVSGTNYKILCFGTLVTKDPVTSWYVLDIYEDPDGNCSVTDAQIFDLTDYISYGDDDAADED